MAEKIASFLAVEVEATVWRAAVTPLAGVIQQVGKSRAHDGPPGRYWGARNRHKLQGVLAITLP